METFAADAPIPTTGDALLIVDAQNDFLPGGRLGVPRGDEIIPVLNEYIAVFRAKELPLFATRDRHPQNHCSFREQGGPWPAHCVAGTEGAEFPPGLALPPSAVVVSKATIPEKDAYSGFEGTDLDARLRQAGVRRLFVGGLATDYCVLNSVKDAVKLGYAVILLEDAIRAVNVAPQDGQKAVEEMIRSGCRAISLDQISPVYPKTGALLVDLYQITMLRGYFDRKMEATAIFEFFVRRLPPGRGFLVAAGLDQVLEYLETLRFAPPELDWLENTGRFTKDFLRYLEGFRFTGDVHAMPEGTVFFPNEPVLRVAAPLPQAQFAETRIINLLQFQTLIASKAARMVLAAPGKLLVDFGLRRAHGAEAGLLAARASYLAGFAGTATVLASSLFGIPTFGTMAHSFVQAHDDESEAFENFARSQPDNVVLLLDTYDTERAAEKVVTLARRLGKEGIAVKGVRLDSGDVDKHARNVRRILDEGGLREVQIFASGNLDEFALRRFVEEKSPVDGFGVGSRLTTSGDAPYLDCVYKLQEYAGTPRRKLSEEKETWPGRKQVYRKCGKEGTMEEDRVALESEVGEGEPLLQPVMRGGRRLSPPVPLAEARRRAAGHLARLPESLRSPGDAPPYPVKISRSIRDLAAATDREIRRDRDDEQTR